MVWRPLVRSWKLHSRLVGKGQLMRHALLGSFLALGSAVMEGLGLGMVYPVLIFMDGGVAGLRETGGVMLRLVDGLEQLGLPVNLVVLLGIVTTTVFLRQGFLYIRAVFFVWVGREVWRGGLTALMDNFLKAPFETVTHLNPQMRNLGEISIDMTGDFYRSLLEGIALILVLLTYGGLLLLLNPQITLLFGILSLLVLAGQHRLIKRARFLGEQMDRAYYHMRYLHEEIMRGLQWIKMRGMEEMMDKIYMERVIATAKVDVAVNNKRFFTENSSQMLFLLLILGVFALAISRFELRLAEIGLFVLVTLRIVPQLSVLNTTRVNLQVTWPHLKKVEDWWKDVGESESINKAGIEWRGLQQGIVYEGVSFAYAHKGMSTEVLRDVHLQIASGEMVALVGRSGAGKSTLVDLLPGMLLPTKGRVLLDGKPLGVYQLRSVRKRMAFVTQRSMFFNNSIRENLLLGLPKVPEEKEIWKALELAHCEEFILPMEAGLDTQIGDEGKRLSGGQQQRLALARALLTKPDLLILDEPTSALDGESEAAIQQGLASLKGKLTIIVIAHRLATIQQADTVWVLEKGRIVQHGTHQELMGKMGPFRRLFADQVGLGKRA